MNKILPVLVSLLIAVPALASREQIEKISAISAELGRLKSELETAQREHRNHKVKFVISAAAAAALGIVAGQVSAGGSGDMGGMMSMGAGVVIGLSAAVPVTIGVYQGYKVYVSRNEIDFFIGAIDQKQEELEAAKNVIQSL